MLESCPTKPRVGSDGSRGTASSSTTIAIATSSSNRSSGWERGEQRGELLGVGSEQGQPVRALLAGMDEGLVECQGGSSGGTSPSAPRSAVPSGAYQGEGGAAADVEEEEVEVDYS